MDRSAIEAAARKRAEITVADQRLRKEEQAARVEQAEAQKARDDYPSLLRNQIIGNLAIKQLADYPDDIATLLAQVASFVQSLPGAAIIEDEGSQLLLPLLLQTTSMLSLKINIPESLVDKPEADLEPYVTEVLLRNLKARTFIGLLVDDEFLSGVIQTAPPVSIGARLYTVAGCVEGLCKKESLEDQEGFVSTVRANVEELLASLATLSAHPYLNGRRPYLLSGRLKTEAWGWRRDRLSLIGGIICLDWVYIFYQTRYWVKREEDKRREISAADWILPYIDRLLPIAAGLEALSETERSLWNDAFYWKLPEAGKTRDEVMQAFEIFGAWTTNGCVCGAFSNSMHYVHAEACEEMLDTLDLYKKSPLAAWEILSSLSGTVGPGSGYDCPDQSMVDNAAKSLYVLRAYLKNERVALVILNMSDAVVMANRIQALLKQAYASVEWRGYGPQRLGAVRSSDRVIEDWLQETDTATPVE